MATVTVVGAFVPEGRSAVTEIQYLKMVYTWSILNNTTGRVKAKLYVMRDEFGPTYRLPYTASITVVNRDNGKTYKKSFDGDSCPTISTQYVQIGSQVTIDVPLNSSGGAATKIRVEGRFSVPANFKLNDLILPCVQYTNGDAEQLQGSVLFTFPAQIGVCTAPTSVTIDKTVVKPGYPNDTKNSGSFTVKWSGAAGGSNNAINGYDIYWRNYSGLAPTTSTYAGKVSISSTSTSGSVTINLGNAPITAEGKNVSGDHRRGERIMVSVRTKGAAGSSYYSGLKGSSSFCYINDLPASPNIETSATRLNGENFYPLVLNTTKNLKILPSDGGIVNFVCSAGADTYFKTTPKVYYFNPVTKEKELVSNLTEIFNWEENSYTEEEKSYSFWTFDGLEYSEPTIVTIKKNLKPKIDSFTVTGTPVNHKRADIPDGANYVVSPIRSYVSTSNAEPIYKLILRDINNTETEQILGSGMVFTDIRALLEDQNHGGLYYKFSLQLNDGYDVSDISESEEFYIAPAPELSNYTNVLYKEEQDEYNIIGEEADTFYKDLTFFVPYDEAYPINYIQAKETEQNIKKYDVTNSQTNPTNGSDTLVYYTFEDLTPGTSYEFSLVSNVVGEEKEILPMVSLAKLAEIETADIKITGFNPTIYKLYTSELDELEIYINKIISDNNDYVVDYKLTHWDFIIDDIITLTSIDFPLPSTENDRIVFSRTKSDIYGAFINTLETIENINKYNGNTPSKTVLRFYTDFGNYYDIVLAENGSPLTISANETLTLGTNSFNNDSTLGYLKEGITLTFNGTANSYNGAPYARVMIDRTPNENSNYVEYINIGQLDAVEGMPEIGSPLSYSFNAEKILGEIATLEYDCNFKIQFSKTANFAEVVEQIFNNSGNSYQVRGHVAPLIGLDSGNYDENSKKININLQSAVSWGISKSLRGNSLIEFEIFYNLNNSETEETTSIDGQNLSNFINNPIISFDFDKPSWSITKLKIKVTISSEASGRDGTGELIGTAPITTKYYTTNYINVYNIAPTISHRPNHIGINRRPETVDVEDAIIIISDYSDYKKIYLINSESGQQRVINLVDGTLTGFTINGGSWDETNSEEGPGLMLLATHDNAGNVTLFGDTLTCTYDEDGNVTINY